MDDDENRRRFELQASPHLAAADNLAPWMTHDDQDAHNAVQEA